MFTTCLFLFLFHEETPLSPFLSFYFFPFLGKFIFTDKQQNVCIQSFVLQVFDRWGEKVFETSDPDKCWDGTYKGAQLNTGVFAYTFKATLSNSTEVRQDGNITLVR